MFLYRPRTQNPQVPDYAYENYLVAFHEHLLLPVCESSNLGCLSYKCGPSLICNQCNAQVTLPYIHKQSESDAEVFPKQIMNCLGQVCTSFLLR